MSRLRDPTEVFVDLGRGRSTQADDDSKRRHKWRHRWRTSSSSCKIVSMLCLLVCMLSCAWLVPMAMRGGSAHLDAVPAPVPVSAPLVTSTPKGAIGGESDGERAAKDESGVAATTNGRVKNNNNRIKVLNKQRKSRLLRLKEKLQDLKVAEDDLHHALLEGDGTLSSDDVDLDPVPKLGSTVETQAAQADRIMRQEEEVEEELDELEAELDDQLDEVLEQAPGESAAKPSGTLDGLDTFDLDGGDSPVQLEFGSPGSAAAIQPKDYGSLPHTERQEAVVEAMRWSWDAYKKFAWGQDTLLPVSRRGDDWFGLGLTIIDALDTMWLMGMHAEWKEGRDWVENNLDLGKDTDVNLFETTIRVLGGLLSNYYLSKDSMFLDKAIDLGDRLLVAFNTESGVPLSDVNLKKRTAAAPRWTSKSSTSEVTTVQLEFKYLSEVSGDPKYAKAVNKVMRVVDEHKPAGGLVPIWIDPKSGAFSGSDITLGARGDSYYEYLLKGYLQTKKTEPRLKEMYVEAVKSVQDRMVRSSVPDGLVFVGELKGSSFSPKMDHLVCFLPGVLALGSVAGLDDADETHLQLAKDLAHTCHEMYRRQKTGLAPEIAYFEIRNDAGPDIDVHARDGHNLLRPETVESLFVLNRLIGGEQYEEWGWEIFQAFETYSRVDTGGYTDIDDVNKIPPPRGRDRMETFWLGETLKYLFLLFGNEEHQRSVLPLDRVVFNTEAHPIPIFRPASTTSWFG